MRKKNIISMQINLAEGERWDIYNTSDVNDEDKRRVTTMSMRFGGERAINYNFLRAITYTTIWRFKPMNEVRRIMVERRSISHW